MHFLLLKGTILRVGPLNTKVPGRHWLGITFFYSFIISTVGPKKAKKRTSKFAKGCGRFYGSKSLFHKNQQGSKTISDERDVLEVLCFMKGSPS